MKTSIALLDIHSATGTILTITLHPVLGFSIVRVAVFALRVVLVAGETGVPRNLMREAHFESAVVAAYVRIGILVLLVYLPAVAGAA